MVPDHELVRRIGRGSYGTIWLARTVTGIWRAVKVVELDGFQDTRPFEREFEGVRRFEPLSREHPALVDILQTGWGQDRKFFYYVMELADDTANPDPRDASRSDRINDPDAYAARTLHSDLRQRRRLPPREAMDLGCRLAEGLEFLHAHGLIHRDIKPSNIIFVAGQPKLADIGLVTDASDARSFVGTEGYVAPEGPNSTHADLYALGMVLYEAGMGRDRKDFPEIAEDVHEEGERRWLLELNAILLKACAADPAKRYPDAASMRADLEHVREGGSVHRRHRMRRWGKSVARGTMGLAVLVGLLALGAWWQANRGDKAPTSPGADRWIADLYSARAQELMRHGDASAALLHLSAADKSAVKTAGAPTPDHWQRVRQQQLLGAMPRITALMQLEAGIASIGFSPDGKRAVIGDKRGGVSVWDLNEDLRVMGPVVRGATGARVRFTGDGRHILVDEDAHRPVPVVKAGVRAAAAMLDAVSGTPRLEGPAGSLFGVFSPDARWLASAQDDRTIVVVDTTSGDVQCILREHAQRILGIVFSPDSQRMASLDNGGSIRIWTLPEGRECTAPFKRQLDMRQLAFTPDSQRLATLHVLASNGSLFQLWDLDRQAVRLLSMESESTVDGMDVRALGGRAMFLRDETQGFLIRSFADGNILKPHLPMGTQRTVNWAMAPDLLHLATADTDGMVRMWNMETGLPTSPSLPHGATVGAMAFSPDGIQLAIGTDDGLVKIWNIAQAAEGPPPIQLGEGIAYVPPGNVPYPARLSRDGRWIATALRQGNANKPLVIDVLSWNSEILRSTAECTNAGGFAWGHQTPRMISFDAFKGVEAHGHDATLWKQEGNGWAGMPLPHPDIVVDAAFTPDDQQVVTRDMRDRVRVWRTSDGSLQSTTEIPLHGPPWDTLAPNGLRLVSLEAGGFSLRFAEWQGSASHPTVGLEQPLWSGQFNRDGSRFASIQMDKSLRILEAPSGRELHFPHRPPPHAAMVDWSPNGDRLLIVDEKSHLHVLHLAQGRLRSLGEAVGVPIRRACFGEDGRCLVVADAQNNVWILDADTLQSMSLRFSHSGEVQHMAVTRAGQLVTFSDPDRIQRWDLKTNDLSVEIVEEAAMLLSARRPGPKSSADPLPPEMLKASHARLGKSAPHLVQRTVGEVRAWRLRQCDSVETLPQLEAAAFHLNQLKLANPEDPAWQSIHDRIATRWVAQREAATPARCIDLTPFYTHSPGLLPDGELSLLPSGLHTLQETLFDVRGMVRIESMGFFGRHRRVGNWIAGSHPRTRCIGIPVRQTCARLAFLQGVSDPEGPNGTEVARWRIHYQDGTSTEFPLRYGRELSDWRTVGSGQILPGEPVPAWSARLSSSRDDIRVRLYKVVWNNPRPAEPVHHLDFLPGTADVRPFVIAITAEP